MSLRWWTASIGALAADAGQLGSARQLHARRDVPEQTQSPLPPAYLSGGTVYDLVYNPEETRLLRDAEMAGCPTHRWAGHARGPGAAAVRMVDGRLSAGRRHAGGCDPEAAQFTSGLRSCES